MTEVKTNKKATVSVLRPSNLHKRTTKEITRELAFKTIDDCVEESTARAIIQWVYTKEVEDEEYPLEATNEDIAKHFGWTDNTTRTALSEAKASGFIMVIGFGTKRTIELNRQALKEKMKERASRFAKRKPSFVEDCKEDFGDYYSRHRYN